MTIHEDAGDELGRLEAAHRLRIGRIVDGSQGPRITLDGADVINLASNDYLSLAGDRRLARAAIAAIDESGAGAGASRLIAGNHRRHVVLEHAIADWMRRDGVRLFGSGYAANVGVLTTLLAPGDVVFSDELNHASIIDGCRLSRAEIVVVPHRDLGALEAGLRACTARRKLVVSESLFSMDGDLADVAALSELCRRHEAALVLDEAHALGARGPEGRGIAAAVGVVPDVLVGTCGKALGAFGAFVATSRPVAELLWNRARSFVFSTAMPPMVAAAIQAAIEIVRGVEGDQRRHGLASHARTFRALVREASGEPDSAIAPVIVGDDLEVMRISARLLEDRVFVQGIRPPTVPAGTARLRVSITAGSTTQDIEIAGKSVNNATRHST